MHNTIEVLLNLLNILFSPHETLHKDIKLFVQPYNLDASVDNATPRALIIVIIALSRPAGIIPASL